MLGRTIINGVANQGRLEMYRQNADVLDGVKWLATLDSRACPVCGVMDGKVWQTDKLHEVKSPPLHPNCRCVLIPYIDIGDESQRPAEAENFDKLAEEEYNSRDKRKKDWDDLSYDYRKQLRYDTVKRWEKENPDKDAYRQLKGATFADYLQEQSPQFRREYLGKTRAELYEQGKLTLDQMVNPDTGFMRTLADLGVKPKEQPIETGKREDELKTLDIFDAKSIVESPKTKELFETYEKTSKPFNETIKEHIKELEKTRDSLSQEYPGMFDKDGFLNEKFKPARLPNETYNDYVPIYNQWVKEYNDFCKDNNRIFFTEPRDNENRYISESEKLADLLFDTSGKDNKLYGQLEGKFVKIPKDAKRGLNNVSKMLASLGWDDADISQLQVNIGRARSQSSGTEIRIALSGLYSLEIRPSIVSHEFGHFFGKNIITDGRFKKFYDEQTVGERPQRIRYGFRKDRKETFKKFKILMPSDYSQRFYGITNNGTETLAVFFEMVATDLPRLVRDYPEFYQAMLGLLKK
jgi:hypothetical protein